MNDDSVNPGSHTSTPPETETRVNQQPVLIPELTQPKSRKTLWAALVVAAGIVLVTGLVFIALGKDSNKGNAVSRIVLNNANRPASKYNRSAELFAVGNVEYKTEKLAPITSDTTLASRLEEIKPVPKEEGLSGVAFVETGDDVYTRRLVLYDFATRKSYTVNEDKGDQKVRHYYNPVILSDHYVAWYTLTYNTPVDLEGSIHVVDLNTGEKKVILHDSVGNLPETNCCSVSPDGLYLVVPLPPNKINFYSVGGERAQEITVHATMVPQSEGQDGDGYAQSQRAVGYPALKWLDSKRIVLATNAPVRYKVDGDGTHIFKANNGLDILDLESGQQTALVKTGTYSIPWFDIKDQTLVFASHTADETLAHGPITGMVSLYVLDTSNSSDPKKIEGITHDKLGALVLDKNSGVLYVQEAASTPIKAVSLSDGSQKTYSQGTPPLIEGSLDSDTLVGGNREGLTPSTKLGIYKLSTGETIGIY